MPAVIKQMDIYPLPHHLCKAPAHLSPSPSLDVLVNHLRQSANRFACYLTLSDIIMTQGTPYLWALWCHFWHGKGTHSWNHSFLTRRYLSCCIVNTIWADVLATRNIQCISDHGFNLFIPDDSGFNCRRVDIFEALSLCVNKIWPRHSD